MISEDDSSSSACTEYDWSDLTEEEAMEIWERRGRQIEAERARRGITDPSVSMHSVPAPPPTAAEEAEWQRLITHNPYSPHDLANREQFLVHQRFINSYRPISGNYIASHPEFAQFLDQYGTSRRAGVQQAQCPATLHEAPQNDRAPTNASVNPNVQRDEGSTWLSAQAREYERLTLQHQQNERNPGNPEVNQGSTNDGGTGKQEKKKSRNDDGYCLGRPGPNEYFTKRVVCKCCQTNLFVPPLASRFYCQTCCWVTTLEEKDKETQFEEKMQDIGDQVSAMDVSPYY